MFIPVENGELCIVDPAGQYLAKHLGSITSKEALPELQGYNSYWSAEAEITNIELYDVNIATGTPTLVKSGSLIQIANFLET